MGVTVWKALFSATLLPVVLDLAWAHTSWRNSTTGLSLTVSLLPSPLMVSGTALTVIFYLCEKNLWLVVFFHKIWGVLTAS